MDNQIDSQVSREQTSSLEAAMWIPTIVGGEKGALPGQLQLIFFKTNQITPENDPFLSKRVGDENDTDLYT